MATLQKSSSLVKHPINFQTPLPDARSVDAALDRALAELRWQIDHCLARPIAQEYWTLASARYGAWQRSLNPSELRAAWQLVWRARM